MQLFEEYLTANNLEALTVSIKGKVRYMTVYNAMKGLPITPEHAQQIRQAVLTMSGIPFTGSFVLTVPQSLEEQPTFQMHKIHKNNFI